jgi:predicted dehydrogenase
MREIKLGIAGLGSIAQVVHLPILSKMTNVSLKAVSDIDASKAKHVASKYNIKNYNRDIDKLLAENEDIDAMIISATTDVHKELAIKCLEAGKDLLIERPIALNAAEAMKIAETAKKRKKKVMVGMNTRFRNDVMLQRTFVRGNEIGEVFYVKTGWIKPESSNSKWMTMKDRAGGGVLIDNGLVMLDLGLWMLNFPEVKSISASNYSHHTKSVEDSNFTMIKFRNGATMTIEASWSLLRDSEYFYCNLFGKEGSAAINPLRIFKKLGGDLLNITPKNIAIPHNIFKKSYENELKHFIGAVRGDHKMISTADEAVTEMKIVEGIYKSAKTGKEVIFR